MPISASIDDAGDSQTPPVASSLQDEGSTVGDTMSAIGLLTNSAMAEPRIDSSQSADKLTLFPMVHAALAIDGHDPSFSTLSGLADAAHDAARPIALPAREDGVSYLGAYLDWVYFLPCFARQLNASLLQNFDDAVTAINYQKHQQQRENEAQNSNSGVSQPPHNISMVHLFEIHLQVAIGIMASPERVRLAHYPRGLHVAALRLLPTVFKTNRNSDIVRCLLLLAVYSLLSPTGGSVWHLLGLALRVCVTSGFHKERRPQLDANTGDLEEERWLFWSVYVMDRYVSVFCNRKTFCDRQTLWY